jgi:hypothetical protein
MTNAAKKGWWRVHAEAIVNEVHSQRPESRDLQPEIVDANEGRVFVRVLRDAIDHFQIEAVFEVEPDGGGFKLTDAILSPERFNEYCCLIARGPHPAPKGLIRPTGASLEGAAV